MRYNPDYLQRMKHSLDYLEDMIQELQIQYIKHPAGKRIRYEIDMGQYLPYNRNDQVEILEYNRRINALQQLVEEGIVLSYDIINENEILLSDDGEDTGSFLENRIAKCIIDRDKLHQHIQELSSTAKMKKENTIKKIVSSTAKIDIFISDNYGIFMNKESKKPTYPIGSTSKRLKLIKSLKDSKKNGKLLADIFYNHNFSQLNKELKNININFKNKLKLKDDLIIKIETGGYKLNKDRFNIRFID